MITTKVFKVKSDTKSVCHCGHEVAIGDEYYIVRTSIPRWVSLCLGCVHLLAQPISVDMKELKKMWVWEEPRKSFQVPKKERKRADEADKVARRAKAKAKELATLKEAEWV